MQEMKPETRLALCIVIVVGSAAYAALVAYDRSLAYAVALGYLAVLLTIFVAMYIGKKKHERYHN